jgi:hypothetical protein
MTGVQTNSGDKLNRLWKVSAKQCHYHKDGHWFMPLDTFPAALFDPNGYILFRTEKDYLDCSYLVVNQRVNVPGGISNIPGYKQMK